VLTFITKRHAELRNPTGKMAEKANAANPASAVDWSIPNAADFAKKEKLARAVMILSNYQLLMKYALANNQVGTPHTPR